MLETFRLSKSYGKESVLIDFNLQVESGEIIGVVGGSGSGKTTLLRLVSGLEFPDGGKIILNNHTVNDDNIFIPPEERDCSLVFQDYALFPNISMRQNIYFGKNSTHNKERVNDLIRETKIEKILDKFPHQCSGGEQQRLSLARALLINPSLLLLDEPTANLDPYSVNLIEEIILDENKKGKTIILTTHDMGQAKRLAKEILFFNKGKLLEQTKAINFFKKPKTKEAQSYINGKILL